MRRFDTSGTLTGAITSTAGEAARIASLQGLDDQGLQYQPGGSGGFISSGDATNQSGTGGRVDALLQAPSALWDPLGRLPDAEGEHTAHLALFYHVSFRFRHAPARGGHRTYNFDVLYIA